MMNSAKTTQNMGRKRMKPGKTVKKVENQPKHPKIAQKQTKPGKSVQKQQYYHQVSL